MKIIKNGGRKMNKIILLIILGLLIFGVDAYAAGDLIVGGNLEVDTNVLKVDSANDNVGIGTDPNTIYKLDLDTTNKIAGMKINNVRTNDGNVQGLELNAILNYGGGNSNAAARGVVFSSQARDTLNLTRPAPFAGLVGVDGAVDYFYENGASPVITRSIGILASHRARRVENSTNLDVTEMIGIQSGGFDDNFSVAAGSTVDIDTMKHFNISNSITTTSPGTTTISKQAGLWIEALSAGSSNYGIVLDGDGAGSDIVFGPNQEVSMYRDSGGQLYISGATVCDQSCISDIHANTRSLI
jgi:hypothetical protein